METGTRRLIVFMEYDLGMLVSIAVLDGYGIHIRSKNARAFNRDRYLASDCVHEISSGTTSQHGGTECNIYSRGRMRAGSTEIPGVQ